MQDNDDLERFERIRRDWPGGTMPAGSDGARRRARKQTHKSKRVAKRIGKNTTGIRRRRNRKAN